MALALDASTPAAVTGAGPWTTASFNPPAGSILVAKFTGDWFSGTPLIAVTSSGLTFERIGRWGATSRGVSEIWIAKVPSSGARTVGATSTQTNGMLKVEVWTGHLADDPIDTMLGGWTENTDPFNPSITTRSDNAWVTGIGSDWQNQGQVTSSDTYESPATSAGVAPIALRKAAATTPAGAVTLNYNAAAGSPNWNWGILSLRAGTATPPTIYKIADRGTLQNVTTGTASLVDLPAAGSIAVGSYLIARLAIDNAGTNGAAPTVSVTDPRSNSWQVTAAGNADPGAANAGSTCYIAYAKVVNAYTNGDDVQFNYNVTVPAKAICIEEWTGIDATTPVAVAAVTGSGATAAVSLARTPTAAGQLFYAAMSVEGIGSDNYTQSVDQTDGGWVMLSQVASTNATATNNQTINGAYKRVTGTTAQTWSPTLPAARDWAGVAIVFAPAAASGITGTMAATLAAQTGSFAGTASASGPLAGTISAQTASFAGTAEAEGPLAGTISAQTAAFTGAVSSPGPITGTLDATLSAQTGSFTGTAKASGALAGTLSGVTAAFSGSAKASGTLAGVLAAQIAALSATAKASGALSGSISSQTAAFAGAARGGGALAGTISVQTASFTGVARVTGTLAGQITPQTAAFTGNVQVASGSGTLNAVLSAQTASFTGEASVDATFSAQLSAIVAQVVAQAKASGVLAGTLSAVTVEMTGTVTGAPRDLTVSITVDLDGPTFRTDPPGTSFATEADGPTFTTDPLGVSFQPASDSTTIGGSEMNPQWRLGSREFIDFTMTLTGDVEGLTLAEVEGLGFKIAIGDTDSPVLADFIVPSVTPVVTAVEGGFEVKIKHLYTSVQTGYHVVYVTFGETPEKPIYQAVTFVVL